MLANDFSTPLDSGSRTGVKVNLLLAALAKRAHLGDACPEILIQYSLGFGLGICIVSGPSGAWIRSQLT